MCYVLSLSCDCVFFFFQQKTAYGMRISDWSSDVCSSDLPDVAPVMTTVFPGWDRLGVRSQEIAMQGKTVVITGATSGIGEVAALKLAEKGARIVLVARDKGRAGAMLDRLRVVAPGVEHREIGRAHV